MDTEVTVRSSSSKTADVIRDVVRRSCGLIVGGAYAFVLYWVCGFSMAAGQGSYLPWFLFVSDRLYGLVPFPFLGTFIALRRHKWAVFVTAGVLVVILTGVIFRYVHVAGDLRRTGDLSRANYMTTLAVLIYVSAQVAGWGLVLKRLLRL